MSSIKICDKENVLIVDFSYFIIYRYHALHTWFKLSQTEYNDDLYLEKYRKLLISNLEKIIKKIGVKKNVILLGDCSRINIWRMQLFPQYKESRNLYWEKNPIVPNIFPMIENEIIPELTSKHGFQYCCKDTMEADDIAYCIKLKLKQQSFSNKIIMLTNDNDYLQLVDETTDIINLPSLKSIMKRGVDNSGKKSMILKILSGDPSDNINGVLGKKKVENILKSLSEEQCNFDENSELLSILKSRNCNIDTVMLNKKLIDMSEIPNELIDSIIIEIYTHS